MYLESNIFSLFFFPHFFFLIRSVRRDVRPRQVRRKAAAHTPFAYTIWKLVTLQIRVRLHPTKLDIPTGWKQYRDSSAETGNWLSGRDRSIRRSIPHVRAVSSCSTWKIWIGKEEKRDKFRLYPDIVRKCIIWSEVPFPHQHGGQFFFPEFLLSFTRKIFPFV